MAEPTPVKATPPADQLKLALERTFLAYERTLMAWIRTSSVRWTEEGSDGSELLELASDFSATVDRNWLVTNFGARSR